jgi:tRNA A-37 threonylcarbamoyl transferase component Bud32
MRNFITKMHTEKKLVHRDLTARNIMIDRDGNWYVIDFGRARPIEIGDDSTDMSEASDVPTAEGAIRALFAKIS